MKRIYIDVSECRTNDSLYRVLLSELGAPDWHGHNLDALWDSITGGDINAITPPYHVEVSGRQRVPTEFSTLLNRVQSMFEEAKTERGIDVCFKIN